MRKYWYGVLNKVYRVVGLDMFISFYNILYLLNVIILWKFKCVLNMG